MPTDGMGANGQVGAVTPNRQTYVRCDIQETVAAEEAWAMARVKGEIKPQPGSTGVMQLTSGAWCARPLQYNMASVNEAGDPTGSIIRLSSMTYPDNSSLGGSSLTEIPTTRPPSDLAGVSSAGGFIPGGWSTEKISGGVDDVLDLVDDHGAFPGPDLASRPAVSVNVTMDRQIIAPSSGVYGPNQSFIVNWQVFGSRLQTPDYPGAFYFGGPLFRDGGGEYCLLLDGTGIAHLNIRLPIAAGEWQWNEIDTWRYCEPSQAVDFVHTMEIRPHSGPGANLIEFRSGTADTAPTGNAKAPYIQSDASPRAHHYSALELLLVIAEVATDAAIIKRVQQDLQNMQAATGAGPIRWDERSDQRLRKQFLRPTYPIIATLVDAPFPVPLYASATTPIRVSWTTSNTAAQRGGIGPEISCKLFSADSLALNAPATFLRGGDNWAEFRIIPGASAYYLVFTFGAFQPGGLGLDWGIDTGYLWGWSAIKDGWQYSTRATEFDANLTHLSLTGPDRDITHETGQMTILDPQKQWPTLMNRAGIPVRIESSYDLADSTKRVAYFHGRIMKPDFERLGTITKDGMGGAGAQQTLWDPMGGVYECDLVGIWKRLFKSLTHIRLNLQGDIDPRLGTATAPFKITDILRAAFGWCGFAPGEIDVPDAPARFDLTPVTTAEDMLLDPFADIGDFIVQTLEEYLLWWCYYDPNAGSTPGMWRVKPPTMPDASGDYANVWTFTDAPPTPAGAPAGTPGAWWNQSLYPAATGPIIRGTYHTWVEPAEFETVQVVGIEASSSHPTQITNWARNIKMADIQAGFHTADSTNRDYSDGTIQQEVITDPGFDSQQGVDRAVWRYYDRLCHAKKIHAFEAPLWYIVDTADRITVETVNSDGSTSYSLQPAYRTLSDSTIQPRMLRFYDPVQVIVNGVTHQCLVRSVHPNYEKDSQQTMMIECQEVTPITSTLPAGLWQKFDMIMSLANIIKKPLDVDTVLSKIRASARKTQYHKQEITSLPLSARNRQDLQDLSIGSPTLGQFYEMPDVHPPDSGLPRR